MQTPNGYWNYWVYSREYVYDGHAIGRVIYMYTKLLNNLETLKLDKIYSYIPAYLDVVTQKNISVLEALVHLTDKEIEYKTEMASKIQISVANFPYIKRYDEYNYDFQPSVNKTQIKDLCSLRFIENKENILFYGTPGVGKTLSLIHIWNYNFITNITNCSKG